MNFAMNLKESERSDKYLDLTIELRTLWNMKMTVISVVIGALGTVTTRSAKRL